MMSTRAAAGIRVRICLAACLALLFASPLFGQEQLPKRMAGPDDWTHHRVVFSYPGTKEEAARNGTLDRWSAIVNNPRYLLQQEKRSAAAKGAFPLGGILPQREHGPIAKQEPCRRDDAFDPDHLPRGVARAPGAPLNRSTFGCSPGLRSKPSQQSLHEDWSENIGSGASAGLGMFPAKYSFDISSANCGSAAQPDFVVYNTGLAGSPTQASVIAYDNLYSGCGGSVPSIYWAYNTGGAVVTSVVLSLDGTQLAFAQTSPSGVASLVLLKWQAAAGESASSPAAPTAETAATYRNCVAPCSLTLNFSNGASDSSSSVFCDYTSDTIYVGDDLGNLHKFSGVFEGTPQEAASPWPVPVSASPLSSPIYDSVSSNIFVGDYLPSEASGGSYCGSPSNLCGYLYSISASSGSIVGTSNRLDYIYGIVDAPLVDGSAGDAYVFAGADGSFGAPSSCGTDVPCSGVFEFPTNSVSGSGIEAQVGPGYEFLMSGTFDNEYFSSSDAASPTGNLYVVGGTGGNNTLFQIPITSGVMSTSAVAGPVLSTGYTNYLYLAGMPITEIYSGGNDYIFLSVLGYGAPPDCGGGGCVMGFDVTSGTINSSTAPTGATPEAGGTSGIIIDNSSAFAGASNIYYTPLADQTCTTSGGTGGCAIQISQASP